MINYKNSAGKSVALALAAVMLVTAVPDLTYAANTTSQNTLLESTLSENTLSDNSLSDNTVSEDEPIVEEVLETSEEEEISVTDDPVVIEEELTTTSVNATLSENETVSKNDAVVIGIMPDDFVITDISELPDNSIATFSLEQSEEERRVGAELPNSYDSRNVDGVSYVTPARDQNYTNLCWAFSLGAVAESDAIKEGLYDSSTNFASPTHMAYFMFHHVTDPLGGTAGAGTTQSSTNNYLGNTAMASLQLAGWQGIADESVVPFSGSAPTTVDDSYAYQDILHVTDAYWAAASDSDSVKNLIMEHGAVTTNMYLSGSPNSNHAYIYNGSNGVTHAITLVGWDDNYSKDNFDQTAPYGGGELQDGAWLAKDSWAIDTNREDGYFWLSYQDSVFSGIYPYISNKVIALDVVSPDKYDHNYQYDGSNGTANSIGSTSGIHVSNIFEAKGNSDGAEKLEAVSFATPCVNGQYSVQIYTNLEEGATDPTAGDAVFSTPITGNYIYAGVHSVELPEAVMLEEGTRFSVVIQLTGGYTYNSSTGAATERPSVLTDKTYSSGWAQHTASLETGRSFYSINDGDTWEDAVTKNEAIIRIKAFTSDISLSDITYPIEAEMVADLPDMEYTGNPLRPEPIIHYKDRLLIKDQDYTVTYSNNVAAGKMTGVATIRGMGQYVTKNPIIKNFTITRRDINSEGITVSGYEGLVYNGTAQTPIVVKDGDRTLPEAAYRITYSNNKNAGTANVVIKGVSNYTGTRKLSFTIAPRSLSDDKITIDSVRDQAYTGKELQIKPVIKDGNRGGTALDTTRDVKITYRNNIMLGLSEIIITGKGNYTGEEIISYQILPRDISKLSMSKIKAQTYQGGVPVRPEIVLRDGTKKLTDDIDFTTIYSNNTNVGTATVTIAGKEGTIYAGSSRTVEFEITKVNLATGVTLNNFGDRSFTTYKEYEQDTMTLTLPNELELVKGRDYLVKYANNTKIGTATMTITAAGDGYTGSITKTFRIVDSAAGKSINDYSDEGLEVRGFAYNREYMFDKAVLHHDWSYDPIEPAVTLYDGDKQLVKGKDYKITYRNNTKVGTAKVIITAIAGSGYTGQREEEFYIVGNPIFVLGNPDTGFLVFSPEDKVYNGQKQTQKAGIRYQYSREGSSKQHEIELKENRSYQITYYDNINAGTASYEIQGIGAYSGTSKRYTFTIAPRDLSTLTVTGKKNLTYTGGALTPNLHIKMNNTYLREGVDYDLTFTNNVEVGTATATFTARSDNPNFTGTKTVTFKIKAKKLSALKTGVDITGVEDTVYDGEVKEPQPIVTSNGNPLPIDDYTVTYGKNTIGPAKNYVLITARTVRQGGSGNFTGSKKIYYNILGKEIDVDTAYDGGEQSYTGKKIKPALDTIETVYGETLTRGIDYTISYHNNTKCGNAAYIKLKGKGIYKGRTANVYFTISPCAVTEENCVISPIKPQKLGTKLAVKPKLTIKVNKQKLKLGRDYTVTYTDNTKVGTGNIVIEFVGNYSGTMSTQFTIK